jgi:hypothetical protein
MGTLGPRCVVFRKDTGEELGTYECHIVTEAGGRYWGAIEVDSDSATWWIGPGDLMMSTAVDQIDGDGIMGGELVDVSVRSSMTKPGGPTQVLVASDPAPSINVRDTYRRRAD